MHRFAQDHWHLGHPVGLEYLAISNNATIRTCFWDSNEGRYTCLIVMAGFHDFSSSKMERQTVPDGYTLGWNSGGVNLPAYAIECMRIHFMLSKRTFRRFRWVICVAISAHQHDGRGFAHLPETSWKVYTIHLPMGSTPYLAQHVLDWINVLLLTLAFPGIPTSHSIRFIVPSAALTGFA